MGGNEFIPKFHNISHKKLVQVLLSQHSLLDKICTFQTDSEGNYLSGMIKLQTYNDIIKNLYTPANLNSGMLTLEECIVLPLYNADVGSIGLTKL